jgi:hypothetical protein
MREAKRITLDQVSQKTKIAMKYLEAIESDQFDVFPSDTYAKGFLRAYAKVVGADPGIITRQFEEEVVPKPVPIHPAIETPGPRGHSIFEKRRMPDAAPQPTPQDFLITFAEESEAGPDETVPLKTEPFLRRDKALTPPGAWRKPAMRAAIVLASAAALYLLWGFLKEHPIRFPERPAAVVPVSGTPTPEVAQAKKARTTSPSAVPTPTVAALKPEPTRAPMPDGVREASRVSRSDPGVVPMRFDDKYHHIVFKGREESWILVGMDGMKTWEFVLGKGAVKTFKAEKYFTVKLGNAAGVDLWYDGEPQGVLGAPGQVVELRLPKQ